ncbi:imidazoleglycerol-phosphate dehydratase HisB [Brevibacterium sp. Marseille-P9724]|uniref:imidazoleglycerol-phosphate dehydratase HisB n=1 Tax=Brevibacterium sp. Marseille-P9724 TaxID=2614125 RepID=UPI00125EF475|nr:imidazoleglycerol-phosphate dehydratase HisB [Brevibacterium sp. Marseille-P9724]
MPQRIGTASRHTSESKVDVTIDLDGTGKSEISTGVPFYDHMLDALARHSLCDLTVKAEGDIDIDVHHTVEDSAITIGWALKDAVGDKAGIRRYGDAAVPLDEALAQAVVDISGRPYFVHTGEPEGFQYAMIGGHFTGSMVSHALESLSINAGLTVHLALVAGRDPHHIAEAEFKAFARALRMALEADPRTGGAIPSTKGAL